MSDKLKGLPRFWKEVKRRNVLRSLAIYAGTAFIILEASTIVLPRWGLPDWSIDLVLYLLILGVFINVIVSWIFDITPQGMQKTKALEEIQPNEKPSDSKKWKAATYVSLVVIVALIIVNVVPTKDLKAGDIQSLLILPFDNFTGDDQLDYVAAGMHSSLIGDMGRISGLRIISKTTANIYKRLELDPNSAYAHFLFCQRRHDEAIVQANLGLELDPLEPVTLGLYGVVMLDVGDYPMAVEILERAFSINPDFGFAKAHLLRAYRWTGQYDDWIGLWKQLSCWDDEHKTAIENTLHEQGYVEMLKKYKLPYPKD
ncbi:MAG: hypothetical protein KAI08_05440 [Bacteroidales bacterium]|nr:hypothetical protein [Bacteroidales bacterium]